MIRRLLSILAAMVIGYTIATPVAVYAISLPAQNAVNSRLQQEISQLQRTAAHMTAATPVPEQESPLIYECQQQPCQNAQEFEVFDAGTATRGPAPMFSVPEFGDVGTFGTGFAVFAPGSVTNPVVTLNTNGTVTVGGQTLTPADIAMLHQLRPGELAFLSRLWRACQQQACLTAVKR